MVSSKSAISPCNSPKAPVLPEPGLFIFGGDAAFLQAPREDRIRATHPEAKRDRVLSEEELRYF
jgi:hypothetical protein